METTFIYSVMLLPSVLEKYPITKQQMILLIGLKMAQMNIVRLSRQGLHRYCEQNHHCWSYSNFRKLLDPLLELGFIIDRQRKLSLSDKGVLILNQIERLLAKRIEAGYFNPT